MITLNNISFRYDNEYVIKNLNFELTKNGIYAIVGESGTGKTTLLKIIAGLTSRYEGEYFMGSTPITTQMIQNNIAYINQEATVSPGLTVQQHFLLISSLYNVDVDDQKIKEYLELVHLHDKKLNDIVDHFSLGEKRRLLICLSLFKNVPIIVMDEPTASLDHKNTRMIMELLKTVSQNTIIIISSHDKDVLPYCDSVFQMEKGLFNCSFENSEREDVLTTIRDKFSISCSKINQFKSKRYDIIGHYDCYRGFGCQCHCFKYHIICSQL